MKSHAIDRRSRRGFTILEVSISAALLSGIFYMALSGYIGSMRGSSIGTAKLESMANNARALTAMNLELQEASVRDETVEVYQLDDDDHSIVPGPIDPTTVPPPDTIYPTANAVGSHSYGLRFMTIGDFTSIGDNIEIQTAGPYLYRLGTGAADDFPLDHLVRVDQSGIAAPQVLCRNVDQCVFQRDSRGGAILITLVTHGRDEASGQEVQMRQVLTVTPKNDFSANLANFDLNGEEI